MKQIVLTGNINQVCDWIKATCAEAREFFGLQNPTVAEIYGRLPLAMKTNAIKCNAVSGPSDEDDEELEWWQK